MNSTRPRRSLAALLIASVVLTACGSAGKWALHCHIVHHTTNNDVEPGGLLMVVDVQA